MNNLKGIIFDFDGTLADTLPLCILSFQQALHKVTGRKCTENDITQHFGKSEEGIIAALAGEHYDEALNEYIEAFKVNYNLTPCLIHGIIDILDELAHKSLKMALITGKGRRTIDIALEHRDLRKYFEYVEHGNPEGIVKTESMIKILENWKLNPSEVAYIGDQPSDITESQKAGVVSIAVSWAKTSNHAKLLKYQPDFLFSDIGEFRNWMNMAQNSTVFHL